MKKFFKWIGIAFGVLIVLGVVGAFFGDPKAEQSASASTHGGQSSAAAPPPPPMAVTASQLFKDYEENEVAADQKYKGKRLAVSGTVQSIDKDAFDNIVIRLRTSNEFMAAHASFDGKHEQMAASLKKGAKINWLCEGGGRIIGSPVLRKCAPA